MTRLILVGLILSVSILPRAVAQASLLADDAGSGGDAPRDFAGALSIEMERVYEGDISLLDVGDMYAFPAHAGDVVEVRIRGTTGCPVLFGPDESGSTQPCTLVGQSLVARWELDEPGRWSLLVRPVLAEPAHYRFAVSVNTPVPDPWPGHVGAWGSEEAVRAATEAPLAPASTTRDLVVGAYESHALPDVVPSLYDLVCWDGQFLTVCGTAHDGDSWTAAVTDIAAVAPRIVTSGVLAVARIGVEDANERVEALWLPLVP